MRGVKNNVANLLNLEPIDVTSSEFVKYEQICIEKYLGIRWFSIQPFFSLVLQKVPLELTLEFEILKHTYKVLKTL
jgi:hypothetical protein